LREFFDLNFRKFVWPKFSNLVFHLEQYLARLVILFVMNFYFKFDGKVY
jgi:hypothetical protein